MGCSRLGDQTVCGFSYGKALFSAGSIQLSSVNVRLRFCQTEDRQVKQISFGGFKFPVIFETL